MTMKGELTMKLIRSIKRYIRDAAKSVVRNFSLSLASISCITITLIVVAVSMIISNNVDNASEEIMTSTTVVIWIEKTATKEDIDNLKKEIENTGNVSSLEFKSKQKFAQELKEQEDKFAPTVDSWTDETNPLMDSYKLKVKDIEIIKDTVKQIEKVDCVNSVDYGQTIVDQVVTVFKAIEKFCIGTVIALVLVTAFLITNTIKIAIYSRKTEIEIMRLVGASNIAIKVPFIIEGMFIGLIGSIIPVLVTIFGYSKLYDYFGGKIFNSSFATLIEPFPFTIKLSLIIVLLGILVGMYGSGKAVKKHLKV